MRTAANLDVQDTVLLHLEGRCLTLDILERKLALPRRQISNAVGRLIILEFVERVELGCYRLTDAGTRMKQASSVKGARPCRSAFKAPADTFPQRLWTAIRMSGAFTIGDAMMAAAKGASDNERTAARYVRHLREAGYVAQLPTKAKGTHPNSGGFKRFRLLKDTGPASPVYSRKRAAIFDRNTGEVLPCDKPA